MTAPDYPPEPHPPMRCGICGEVLVWEASRAPSLRPQWGTYTHAGPMTVRHRAEPGEPWSDVDAETLERWTRWRPPTWEYPPLPGVVVNPEPGEPPVGTRLAMAHRPDECVWYRGEHGWRMPEWDANSAWPLDTGYSWLSVRTGYGPLVVCT